MVKSVIIKGYIAKRISVEGFCGMCDGRNFFDFAEAAIGEANTNRFIRMKFSIDFLTQNFF